jgi:hypothetical protein
MNIIDSSGWLEYFADGPNASFFSHPLQKTGDLVVPTITIYEAFKAVPANATNLMRSKPWPSYSRVL